jgi:hypothetical protein
MCCVFDVQEELTVVRPLVPEEETPQATFLSTRITRSSIYKKSFPSKGVYFVASSFQVPHIIVRPTCLQSRQCPRRLDYLRSRCCMDRSKNSNSSAAPAAGLASFLLVAPLSLQHSVYVSTDGEIRR